MDGWIDRVHSGLLLSVVETHVSVTPLVSKGREQADRLEP